MSAERIVELAPINVPDSEWDEIEARILEQFRVQLYLPLLAMLKAPLKLLNSPAGIAMMYPAVRLALNEGRLKFEKGRFIGQLNAEITKELRAMGAVWVKRPGVYELAASAIPPTVLSAISMGNARFLERTKLVEDWLTKFLPEKLAERIESKEPFERVLSRTDSQMRHNLKRTDTIGPKLTPEQKARFGAEWQGNLDLWIRDFTEKQIIELRKTVADSVYAGRRYETLVKGIQQNYGVTVCKAKFLARQETKLAVAKFTELRYQAAGIEEYRWGCVVGSPKHPVRPAHKALEGKIFRFDSPPVTTAPGEPQRRNNPGQDYNCRCKARPIVRFKEGDAK